MAATFQFETAKKPLKDLLNEQEQQRQLNQHHHASSSGKFQPTSRTNPCPICNDTSGDCRIVNWGALCMKNPDGVGSVPGFNFIGQTKDNLWGKWITDDHNSLWKDYDQWRQAKDSKRQTQLAIEARRRESSLSTNDRNIQFRQISKHSGISQSHRQNLETRLLTPEQIDRTYGNGLVWTWQPGASIPGTTPALPGIDKQGKLRRYKGLAIGIPDIHGNILGAQIKPDYSDGYRWISSAQEENRTDGAGPQLPNGEIPIGVYIPKNLTVFDRIGFAEGYLKPLIAAERFGMIMIGCAGGNWANSPEQLQQSIQYLLEWLPQQTDTPPPSIALELFADGGAVANKHVCTAYEKLHRLLAQWNYPLRVRWWNQLEKSNGDVDEINQATFEGAIALTWEEYRFLGMRYGGISRETAKDKWRRETEAIQAKLNGLNAIPTVTGKGQYIDRTLVNLPEKSGIILLQGPMGIGKTATALHELVGQHQKLYPDAFQGLFVPRNMLGYQSAGILELPHHTQIPEGVPLTKVTMCLESWWKLSSDKLPQAPPLLIFDEASQVFEQLLYGDTCKDYHVAVLNRLRELLRYVKRQKGWIILSEDGLTNLELNLVQTAADLELVEYFNFEKENIIARDYRLYDSPSAVWQDLTQRLQRGENVVLASDSCRWLRQSEKKCRTLGIRPDDIYILDSNSAEERWAKAFTANPDHFINIHKPRVLGYSPTIQSGLSIKDEAEHFNAMALHLVHLQPRVSKQLVERLRSNVPRFGYIKPVGGAYDTEQFSSCRPKSIIKDLYRNFNGIEKLTRFAEYANQQQNKDDLLAVMADIQASQTDKETDYGFWLTFWSQYKAREQWGKLHLKEHLITIWKEQGHEVQLIQKSYDPELAKQRKAIQQQLEQQEATTFANLDTEGISIQESLSIMNTPGSTAEQRQQAKKRLLEERLPKCPLNDPAFVFKTVVENQGRFLKASELLWFAQHPIAAQLTDQWNWSNAMERASSRNEIVWLPDLSNRSAQAKLMSECPLTPFITGEIEQWDNHTPEAIAVHEWAYFHRNAFRRYLRLEIKAVRPDDCSPDKRSNYHTPVQVVNKLLKKLGLIAQQAGWKGSRDNRLRQYHLINLEDQDRNTILNALTERFLKRCQTNQVEAPESVVIASGKVLEDSASCDHALPNVADLDPESQVEIQEYWTIAQSDEEKSAVLLLLEEYRARRVG